MRKLSLVLLALIASTAFASPIDGGPCNGGGTLAQFQALTQGCTVGDWTFFETFAEESTADPHFSLSPGVTSTILLDPIRVTISGDLPATFLRFRLVPTFTIINGTGIEGALLRSVRIASGVTLGDPADVGFTTPFDLYFSSPGTYEAYFEYAYITAPEPASSALISIVMLLAACAKLFRRTLA